MNNSNVIFKSMALLLLGTSTVQAEEGEKYPGWIVGAGYVIAPNPFIGDADDASQLIPVVGYIGERLTWLGPYLGYRLTDRGPMAISVVAELAFEGFEHDPNDPVLQGLRERKGALAIGFDVELGPMSIAARTDVSDRHGGYSLAAGLGQSWELLDDLELGVSANAGWRSADIVNYYYGVSNAEATVSRPSYTAGSALNYGVGLELNYRFSDRTALLFGGDVTRFDDKVRRSPLVEDDYEMAAYIAIVYQLFE